jgi:hypothetical protein
MFHGVVEVRYGVDGVCGLVEDVCGVAVRG